MKKMVFDFRELASGLTVGVWETDAGYTAAVRTPADKWYYKNGYSTLESARSRLYTLSARCSASPDKIEEIAETLQHSRGKPLGMPSTPIHLRLPDWIREKASAKGAKEGKSLSAVLIGVLEEAFK